jgi:hypothetical protein
VALICADSPARQPASAWPRVVDRLEAVSRIGGPVVGWLAGAPARPGRPPAPTATPAPGTPPPKPDPAHRYPIRPHHAGSQRPAGGAAAGHAVLIVHDGYGHLTRRDPSACITQASAATWSASPPHPQGPSAPPTASPSTPTSVNPSPSRPHSRVVPAQQWPTELPGVGRGGKAGAGRYSVQEIVALTFARPCAWRTSGPRRSGGGIESPSWGEDGSPGRSQDQPLDGVAGVMARTGEAVEMSLHEYRPGTAFPGGDRPDLRQLQPGLAAAASGPRGRAQRAVPHPGRHRVRHLGCHGSPIRTPNLDSLAEGGPGYSNMRTSPTTKPRSASPVRQ